MVATSTIHLPVQPFKFYPSSFINYSYSLGSFTTNFYIHLLISSRISINSYICLPISSRNNFWFVRNCAIHTTIGVTFTTFIQKWVVVIVLMSTTIKCIHVVLMSTTIKCVHQMKRLLSIKSLLRKSSICHTVDRTAIKCLYLSATKVSEQLWVGFSLGQIMFKQKCDMKYFISQSTLHKPSCFAAFSVVPSISHA